MECLRRKDHYETSPDDMFSRHPCSNGFVELGGAIVFFWNRGL
jgi:hypothetical protein